MSSCVEVKPFIWLVKSLSVLISSYISSYTVDFTNTLQYFKWFFTYSLYTVSFSMWLVYTYCAFNSFNCICPTASASEPLHLSQLVLLISEWENLNDKNKSQFLCSCYLLSPSSKWIHRELCSTVGWCHINCTATVVCPLMPCQHEVSPAEASSLCALSSHMTMGWSPLERL